MAMIKVKCPICGKETQANDERSFAFCTECGNRFELEQTKQGEHAPSANVNEVDPQAELEKGLEEAAFYYNLSYEKKEADHLDKRPEYYEKAQEKLLSLSQSFPSDYRVWWELSKPLDYNDPAGTKDVKGDFGISEKYFNKALDLSTLEGKKELISKKDKYDTEKRKVIETHLRKIEEKKAAEEKERQALIKAEQEKKLAEQQEQLRLKEEAEKEKAERARQRKEALNEEKPVLIAGIYAILSWVLLLTAFFPILFSILSLNQVKKATNSKHKALKKIIVVSDIICLAFIALVIVLGVMGMI